MSQNISDSNAVHRLFRVGVLIKGMHGLIELTGAVLIYLTSGSTLLNIVTSITTNELTEDPNDLLANFLLQTTSHVSQGAKDFAALYLLVSAIVNLLLTAGLLAEKKKAFPAAIGIIALFILYQSYLFIHTHSPWLVVLTLYDCVIIVLIYLEHKRNWGPITLNGLGSVAP